MRAGNALLDAAHILAHLDIPRGAVVLDVGAGCTGHFALHAAELVGHTGRVIAVDILRDALAQLRGSAVLRGFHHLDTLWGDAERSGGIRLPDEAVDYALLVHALHAMRERTRVAEEMRRLVRPGGTVLVIDWDPRATHSVSTLVANRFAPEESDRLFLQQGYVRVDLPQPSPHHWGRMYRRTGVT